MHDWVKNRIVTCEKYIFQFEEEGYKQINVLDSSKTYCLCLHKFFNSFIIFSKWNTGIVNKPDLF